VSSDELTQGTARGGASKKQRAEQGFQRVKMKITSTRLNPSGGEKSRGTLGNRQRIRRDPKKLDLRENERGVASGRTGRKGIGRGSRRSPRIGRHRVEEGNLREKTRGEARQMRKVDKIQAKLMVLSRRDET